MSTSAPRPTVDGILTPWRDEDGHMHGDDHMMRALNIRAGVRPWRSHFAGVALFLAVPLILYMLSTTSRQGRAFEPNLADWQGLTDLVTVIAVTLAAASAPIMFVLGIWSYLRGRSSIKRWNAAPPSLQLQYRHMFGSPAQVGPAGPVSAAGAASSGGPDARAPR